MNEGDALPYGALGGERNSADVPHRQLSAQWHTGAPVVVRPSKVTMAACLAGAVTIGVIIVTQYLGPPFVSWLLGAVAVFLLIVAAEALVGQVRVDSLGISLRSLRGTRSYRREELDMSVLHRYMRPSRSGRHLMLRLTVRRSGGRYAFQITSDLYPMSSVDRVAGLVNAMRVTDRRPADVETRYPGSTRPWQRHPVLFFIFVAVVTWIVAGIAVATML